MPNDRENNRVNVAGKVKKARVDKDANADGPPSPKKSKKKVVKHYSDDRTLSCPICLEVLYNAMNVSPCNHKFCASCIYRWNDNNPSCPQCRLFVDDISRDPVINTVVDQFVAAHPERDRNNKTKIDMDEIELRYLEKYKAERIQHERDWISMDESHDGDDDDDMLDGTMDGVREIGEDDFNLDDYEEERHPMHYRNAVDEARIVRLTAERDAREQIREQIRQQRNPNFPRVVGVRSPMASRLRTRRQNQ